MTLVLSAMLATAGIAPPDATLPVSGYASKYDPTVFETVVRHRFDNDWWRVPPPADWYMVEGYAATTDCAQVGRVVMLRPAGAVRWSRVLVADCAGDEASLSWMLDNHILVELSHDLWRRWSEIWGAPLAVEMRS